MKIDQIFFCGDSQEEIFLLCRDYARVRKNKEIEFFSRARIEEIFAKLDKDKNIILVVSFSRFKKLPILSLLEEVRKINQKNIIIGVTKEGPAPEYVSGCDAVISISNMFLNIGLQNIELLENARLESDIVLFAMFFSKNIHRMSRDRMIQFFEEPDWAEVEIFIKKYNKKRA
ncbi:MAG: hypothetical protein KBF62_01075 [Candidatus Pacebacteria bacterium]|nr:hypothetical protein [Candidatus Paceibacterota bacterium]MBP9058213.1 hypothetical protein [Candidatus Paceibacterota bacterium]MBP9770312.1 hypothetical protein [Candidatus Paceibacterota bacterium]